jgi:hypothetical protein
MLGARRVHGGTWLQTTGMVLLGVKLPSSTCVLMYAQDGCSAYALLYQLLDSMTRASQNAVKTSTQACVAAGKVAIQGDQAERVADRIAVDAEA